MIPNYQGRSLDSSGVSDMASFGISLADSAHIMTILRDTLYSDKVLAVIREYSANAWDAHNMVGKGDLPIKVVLPTQMDPTLIIRDYGPGLSHDDVFKVYTQYGASTKRTSNVAVGQLGIGSKSGFAYSDSFTITSCNGGKRRTYVAVLDETEKGTINFLDEEDCGIETGVAIQIPIKPEDIREFVDKAENLFKFFSPRPDINITLPPEIPLKTRLKSGLIYDTDYNCGTWLAVMGCIPYRINLAQLSITQDEEDKSGVGNWVHKLSGALFFNIGEVHISASREELKYSKSTKQAIIDRFIELIDEFVTNTLAAIQNGSFTSWEKRLKSQILTRFDLPVPDECKDLVKSFVIIQDQPDTYAKTFKFSYKDKSQDISHFTVSSGTRIVIVDDPRKISGFRLAHSDITLYKTDEKATWEEIRVELDNYLIEYKLDGVPIVKLSEQTWTAPFSKRKIHRPVNPKHLRRSFTLTSKTNYSCPFSDAWEPTDPNRLATDDDVFVLIDGFKTDKVTPGFDIYHVYKEDREITKHFSIDMPVIYGYKTTDKKPLQVADCAGTYYPNWRNKFFESLASDKANRYVKIFEWQKVCKSSDRCEAMDSIDFDKILGPKHIVTQIIKKIRRASSKWEKFDYDKQRAIQTLSNIANLKSEAYEALSFIYDRYPLLNIDTISLRALWYHDHIKWLDYVKLMDSVLASTPISETNDQDDEGETDE